MKQLLLLPDPRPLVERLGPDFFTRAPERPGVYLMRDAADRVLYVGKAKNLRKRLGSYRVANPDRLRRRHLRLLRAVERIELQECPDETAALARESELLRQLRPSFNRAGTWAGPPRFVAWRMTEVGLELTVTTAPEPGWHIYGPLGAGAPMLRATLVRLLWRALCPERGYAGMPHGWADGGLGERTPRDISRVESQNRQAGRVFSLSAFESAIASATADGGEGWGEEAVSPVTTVKFVGRRTLRYRATEPATLEEAARLLSEALSGEPDGFTAWIRQRTASQSHPFEVAMTELDLATIETLKKG